MGLLVVAEPAVDAEPDHDDGEDGGHEDEEDAADEEAAFGAVVAAGLVVEVGFSVGVGEGLVVCLCLVVMIEGRSCSGFGEIGSLGGGSILGVMRRAEREGMVVVSVVLGERTWDLLARGMKGILCVYMCVRGDSRARHGRTYECLRSGRDRVDDDDAIWTSVTGSLEEVSSW